MVLLNKHIYIYIYIYVYIYIYILSKGLMPMVFARVVISTISCSYINRLQSQILFP